MKKADIQLAAVGEGIAKYREKKKSMGISDEHPTTAPFYNTLQHPII